MHFTKNIRHDRAEMFANVYALYRGMHDQRIQWYIKIMSLLIIAYVVSPVDLIPDFIPVLGLLDEIILVPIAITCVVSLIPRNIFDELVTLEQEKISDKKIIYLGGILVVGIWISITAIVYLLLI